MSDEADVPAPQGESAPEERAVRAALAALRRDAGIGRADEDATVARLRRLGLLRTRAGWRSTLLRVAAAIALVAAGLAAGRRIPPASPPDGPRFLLLLERDGNVSGPGDEAARVTEYAAWAGRLATEGRLVVAEKLAPDAIALDPGDGGAPREGRAGSSTLGGFFLVRATDEADALAIARACPHLRHGGRVVVRRIEAVPGRG